ncbi:conserved integral membrane protein [Mycobacterium ulcerans subsp. shinshuense]|uniref:Conserved integral membrane protein n=1 Tax=Mycobacterium ulcerans subsp. shinshuense TaxID=1124626 RepID=A0A1B4Y589_MYCUL|nr:conserved integral membrane protein [Mycobacterium ulcerans subsp. shinshuense]
MAIVEVSASLALGAALLAGVGYVVLQRSAQQVTEDEVGHFTLLHLSLRHGQWWLGSAAALSSFTLQAIALTMRSVVLVQSLQATALLFALPIDSWLTQHRITAREWMWAILLAGAVAVIVTAGDPTAGHARAPLSTWAVVAAVMIPALVVCVVAARVTSGALSAVLLAVSSASCAGRVHGVYQRRCRAHRHRLRAASARPRVLRLDDGAADRSDASAIIAAGRLVDRVIADHHRGQAGDCFAVGGHGARRGATDRRLGRVCVAGCRCGGDRGHRGAGSRRSCHDGARRQSQRGRPACHAVAV